MRRWLKRLLILALLLCAAGLALSSFLEARRARQRAAEADRRVEEAALERGAQEVVRVSLIGLEAIGRGMGELGAALRANVAAIEAAGGDDVRIIERIVVRQEDPVEIVVPAPCPDPTVPEVSVIFDGLDLETVKLATSMGREWAVSSNALLTWRGSWMDSWQLTALPVAVYIEQATSPEQQRPLPRTVYGATALFLGAEDGAGWAILGDIHPAAWAWDGRLGEARAGVVAGVGQSPACGVAGYRYQESFRELEACGRGRFIAAGLRFQFGLGWRVDRLGPRP